MITITFVTHATSLDNERQIASGHFDTPLSETGRQQAREMGQRYEHEQIDAVFCSDLQRSYITGQTAFGHRPIPLLQDARLRECDYGQFTQAPKEEIEAQKLQHITTPFPGGESYQEATERVKSFLRDLFPSYDGKHIIIIGHAATHFGLKHYTTSLPLKEIISAPFAWQPGWTYHVYESLQ
jgi:broad specificity phosphatase PhoE